MIELDIYSFVTVKDGRARDRFFIAPKGLGLAEAKKQKLSGYVKTREAARRRLVDEHDKQKREASR